MQFVMLCILIDLIQVSCNELLVSSAIDYLDINKSCGLDGIYAEHLKFGSYLIIIIIIF